MTVEQLITYLQQLPEFYRKLPVYALDPDYCEEWPVSSMNPPCIHIIKHGEKKIDALVFWGDIQA